MIKFYNETPIIIMGMHRSGTTLLTKLLVKLDIYFGAKVEHNNESIFFLKTNEKILKICNSSWNNPYDFDKNSGIKEDRIMNYLEKRMREFKKDKGYWSNYNKNINHIWGWKDPRNTITIGLWRKIFPKAKIIHIYRNPIDVALSLQNREKRFTKNGKIRWYYNAIKNYVRLGIYVKRASELENLEEGLRLWEYYVKKGLNYENVFHIKYEELLEKPIVILRNLILFLKVKSKSKIFSEIIGEIDITRKNAFKKKNIFYDIKGIDIELIKELGYYDIIKEND